MLSQPVISCACSKLYLKKDFCRSLDPGLSSALQGLSVTDTHLVEIEGETLSLYGSGALECLDRNWSVQTASMVTTVSFTFIEFDEIVQVLPKLKMKFPNSLVNTFLWKFFELFFTVPCVLRPKPDSASVSVVFLCADLWRWNLNQFYKCPLQVCVNIRNCISKNNPLCSRKDQWNSMSIIYFNFTKKATQSYSMYSGIETGMDGTCMFICMFIT